MNTLQHMLQKVSTFLVLTYCFHRPIMAGDNFRFGKKLSKSTFLVIDNLGLQMCLSECEAYAMCLSINHNRELLLCELNSVKENIFAPLITDGDFVYYEIADRAFKVCGSATCNSYSKCVKTSFSRPVCIPMICSNDVPEIKNGFIAFRKYMPPSATYECNPGFFGVGDKNTTRCVPGRNWDVPNYECKKSCPSSWEIYETSQYCYVHVDQGLDWGDAKVTCEEMDAYLIELKSWDEGVWISENVTAGEAPVLWIGLSVVGSDGIFYWNHSQTPHGDIGWEPGYPLYPLERRCAGMDTGSETLKNFPCNYTMGFVCKKPFQ